MFTIIPSEHSNSVFTRTTLVINDPTCFDRTVRVRFEIIRVEDWFFFFLFKRRSPVSRETRGEVLPGKYSQ